MYTPKHFIENDPERLARFIQNHAFGILVTAVDGRPEASHIPFLFDADRKLLRAHLAAANPQVQQLESAREVMVIFQGPHGYISPSWYERADVPTWNYTTVHVYGRPELVTDGTELRDIVDTLSNKYEAQFDDPWEPVYDAKQLRAITGFRVHISEMRGKFKLSQNRSAVDRGNVVRELQETGRASDLALAQFMTESGS